MVAPRGGVHGCSGGVAKGGVHGEGGHVWQRGGMRGEGEVCMAKGGVHGERGGTCVVNRGACVAKGGVHGMHPLTPEIRPVIARAVRILLECILV